MTTIKRYNESTLQWEPILRGPRGYKGDQGDPGNDGLDGADGTPGVVTSATPPANTELVWHDTTDDSAGGVVISNDFQYIVRMTQAEYDAITPDENTLYVIVTA